MKLWEEAAESLKNTKTVNAMALLSMSIQVQTLKILERIEERLANKENK